MGLQIFNSVFNAFKILKKIKSIGVELMVIRNVVIMLILMKTINVKALRNGISTAVKLNY